MIFAALTFGRKLKMITHSLLDRKFGDDLQAENHTKQDFGDDANLIGWHCIKP